MMKFEIFLEGYIATGQRGKANYFCTGEGDNFKEAFKNYVMSYIEPLNDKDKKRFLNDCDFEIPSFWGCRAFDNEEDAKKRYG